VAVFQRHQAAARKLKEAIMPKTEIQNEMQKMHAEPLLPIEKTLIVWSLGIGIVLLVVLVLFNKYFPI
jgi:hypothetical protein